MRQDRVSGREQSLGNHWGSLVTWGKKENISLLLHLKVWTHKTAARLFNGVVLYTWEMPELSYEPFYSRQGYYT